MGIIELVLIAIGLSMDAFAVSICKGLAMPKMSWKSAGIIGLYFGAFQALMPLIGYFLGISFQDKIMVIDHWIAFVLLAIIGINMIREALEKESDSCDLTECEEEKCDLRVKTMLVLAVATSIDALAVGITFAFLQVNIVPAVTLIGVITLVCSIGGVKIGNVFGTRYKSRAELAGGIILILIGLKILLEHLGILAF